MEVTPLTCAKCATSWKLIKAGKGPITCPHCKAPLDGPIPAAPATTAVAAPPTESAARVAAPAAVAAPPAEVPLAIAQSDDPGLRADYDERMEEPARRAPHPLLRMSLILLLLITLTPVAAVIVLLVVCAALLARA
ncbi:MAG TPA: hypothetical protein VKE40_07380 [Gemmataceae bacterium]|nr:hypothetical protein [Gemmataceae bacterium]